VVAVGFVWPRSMRQISPWLMPETVASCFWVSLPVRPCLASSSPTPVRAYRHWRCPIKRNDLSCMASDLRAREPLGLEEGRNNDEESFSVGPGF